MPGLVAASETIVSGPLRFEEHLIMDKYAYPFGIAAADLDNDGDMDLTSADALPHNALYWFENKSRGIFQRHFVQKNDPERLERHAIGDIDGDGYLDVVIVKNLHGDLLWFRNSGTPTNGQLWQRNVITKNKLPGAYDVALADLDRDGDLDVAASSWVLGNQFAWFENEGSVGQREWKKHLIEADLAETRAILAGDVDGDGDMDLVCTVTAARLVVWFENALSGAVRSWQRHVIDDTARRPMHGQLIDMDGDQDLDLVLAIGMPGGADKSPVNEHVVVWYENSKNKQNIDRPIARSWKKHEIASGFPNAFEAVASDLDGDGDPDVVASGWAQPGQVAWFQNHGDPRGAWTKHMIKNNWRRATQVITADFDGDGRPDVAACAERFSLELRWWRNLGLAPSEGENP